MFGDISGPRPLGNSNNTSYSFNSLTITSLSPSQPVLTNGSSQLTSGTINLASGSFVSGILGLPNGGTNANLTASNGGIVWSNASQLQILSGTATANQVLLSGSSATPAWSTATYPATVGANAILYASSSNTISGLSTPIFGSVLTSSGGVPTWVVTLSSFFGGTGVNNGTSLLSYDGNVTFSGAFNFTGTLTNNTSITFPTSGTLATTTVIYQDAFSYSRFGGL